MYILVSDFALSARFAPEEPGLYRLPRCLLLYFQFRTVLARCRLAVFKRDSPFPLTMLVQFDTHSASIGPEHIHFPVSLTPTFRF
jgi:hypothetical protein